MQINRVIVIVLDSVGIGELPDAAEFGDVGSHTLGNMARVVGGLNVPNMEKMGLGNIAILKVSCLRKSQRPSLARWLKYRRAKIRQPGIGN